MNLGLDVEVLFLNYIFPKKNTLALLDQNLLSIDGCIFIWRHNFFLFLENKGILFIYLFILRFAMFVKKRRHKWWRQGWVSACMLTQTFPIYLLLSCVRVLTYLDQTILMQHYWLTISWFWKHFADHHQDLNHLLLLTLVTSLQAGAPPGAEVYPDLSLLWNLSETRCTSKLSEVISGFVELGRKENLIWIMNALFRISMYIPYQNFLQ